MKNKRRSQNPILACSFIDFDTCFIDNLEFLQWQLKLRVIILHANSRRANFWICRYFYKQIWTSLGSKMPRLLGKHRWIYMKKQKNFTVFSDAFRPYMQFTCGTWINRLVYLEDCSKGNIKLTSKFLFFTLRSHAVCLQFCFYLADEFIDHLLVNLRAICTHLHFSCSNVFFAQPAAENTCILCVNLWLKSAYFCSFTSHNFAYYTAKIACTPCAVNFSHVNLPARFLQYTPDSKNCCED